MGKGKMYSIIPVLIVTFLLFGCDKIVNVPVQNNEEVALQPQKQTEKLESQIISLDPGDFENQPLLNDSWEFTTVPEGAYVYLNGKRVGRTPIIMEQLPPPATVLSVIKDGYRWHHQEFGRQKPSSNQINLTPGNWASQEEIEKTISELKLRLEQAQQGHWQLKLGHMQLEQFTPSPNGDHAIFFLKRRIPEDVSASKTTTFIKTMAVLQFSPQIKLDILEYRPVLVGRDMFFTKILGWLDNDRLLYLEDAPEPGGKDPYYHGKALQVIQVSTGEKKLLHWIPPSVTIGYDSWLSANKDILYFATRGRYYQGAIGRIQLDTGEYRLIKSNLEMYEPFDDLFVEKSASGDKVVHLLNYQKDKTMPIFDLLTGETADLTPKGAAAVKPVWSPVESLVAVKVAEPNLSYQVFSIGEGIYLESGTIWVVNEKGERISRVNIPGKHLGDPLWLPDGRSLVFQALKRTELSPEEKEMLPDKWRLEGEEIYRSDLDGGNPVKLPLPEGKDFKLERVLNKDWLLAVNYPQGRPNYILVSTAGKEAVSLPSGTWQVLGMAGAQVLTCDDQKRICMGYPGQELRPLVALDDLLSYHWFVNDQWLVLVDMGSNIADPSSLRIIKL